eukprot:jgi/Mesen1/5350/ME000267S04492
MSWKLGFDPNERDGPGRTPLHHLCHQEKLSPADLLVLKRLLEAGADPNAKDGFGRAPLSLVCMGAGHVEAVTALLGAGAQVGAEDDWGRTALHWCCDRGRLEAATLLIEHGANVTATTKQGDSALLWASKGSHLALVELLLMAGSDISTRNNRGESATDVATDDLIRALIASKSPSEESERALEVATGLDGLQPTASQSLAEEPKAPDAGDTTTSEAEPFVAPSSAHLERHVPALSTSGGEREDVSGAQSGVGLSSESKGLDLSSPAAFSAYASKPAQSSQSKKMKISLKKK